MYTNVVYTILDQLISYIDICPMGILFRTDPQYTLCLSGKTTIWGGPSDET